jgi:hypothetical protein
MERPEIEIYQATFVVRQRLGVSAITSPTYSSQFGVDVNKIHHNQYVQYCETTEKYEQGYA